MEHASLQTSALGDAPSRDFGHFPRPRVSPRVKERRSDGPGTPTEAPAAGGIAAGDLHVDHVLSGRPLRHSDLDEREGEAAGVARDGVEQGLPRPHRHAPLPDQARLLRHSHPAEVAEGEETRVLQALLGREAEEDGDETRNGAAAQQQLLQLRWRRTAFKSLDGSRSHDRKR